MFWLPTLKVGPVSLALPMSDRSAVSLIRLLLRDPTPESAATDEVSALSRQLAHDPPLWLWIETAARQYDPPRSATAVSLVRWVWDRRFALFPGDWVEQFRPVDGPTADLKAMKSLVRHSLHRAYIAAAKARAAGEDDTSCAQAYGCALASTVGDWIALRTEGRVASDSAETPPCVGGTLRSEASLDLDAVVVASARVRAEEAAEAWAAPLSFAETAPIVFSWIDRWRHMEQRFEKRLEEEKLASLGNLAAGLGHDFNNPLAIIRGRAELLLRRETDPLRRRDLATIVAQTTRAFEMIADLRLCSRPPSLSREGVDVAAMVRDAVEAWANRVAERRIAVRCRFPCDHLVIEADPVQLRALLDALCKNAVEAIGHLGEVCVSAEWILAKDCSAEHWLELRVVDNGPGIPPRHHRHLFDPFFSGREAGRGLGFGLSKARRIALDHGGTIELETSDGRGATIVVRLPRRGIVTRNGPDT